MSRLGPQAKRLFTVSERTAPSRQAEESKKYTFILPTGLMKRVKHTAIEEDKTISAWLAEAIEEKLRTRT
mgnify:CR=1 FL=1